MTRTVIIDGDVLCYLTATAIQESFEIEEDEDKTFIYSNLKFANKKLAAKTITKLIIDIMQKTKSKDTVIAFSDNENNFRKQINPNYKANRKRVVKPILLKWLRGYLKKENCRVFERPNLEADDVIGILATSEKIIKGDKVVWSLDKDFNTIPCKFRRASRFGKDTSTIITEEMADWFFMYQTLIGDSVDGYTGCKDIGEKRAKKLLGKIGEKSLEEMWEIVQTTYEKKGMTKEEALLNARMARILRASDYDFKKKEVILWKL